MIDDQDLANVRTAVQSRHLRAGVAMPVRIAEGLLEEADRARLLDGEVERLRRVEAAARSLLEGEFRPHHHEGWVEFTERRVAALRTALGVTS